MRLRLSRRADAEVANAVGPAKPRRRGWLSGRLLLRRPRPNLAACSNERDPTILDAKVPVGLCLERSLGGVQGTFGGVRPTTWLLPSINVRRLDPELESAAGQSPWGGPLLPPWPGAERNKRAWGLDENPGTPARHAAETSFRSGFPSQSPPRPPPARPEQAAPSLPMRRCLAHPASIDEFAADPIIPPGRGWGPCVIEFFEHHAQGLRAIRLLIRNDPRTFRPCARAAIVGVIGPNGGRPRPRCFRITLPGPRSSPTGGSFLIRPTVKSPRLCRPVGRPNSLPEWVGQYGGGSTKFTRKPR